MAGMFPTLPTAAAEDSQDRSHGAMAIVSSSESNSYPRSLVENHYAATS
jgi:hypothetical protein